jgi:hypothetical protein
MKITIEHSDRVDFVLNVSVNGKLLEEIRPGHTRSYVGYYQVSVAPGNKYERTSGPPKEAA